MTYSGYLIHEGKKIIYNTSKPRPKRTTRMRRLKKIWMTTKPLMTSTLTTAKMSPDPQETTQSLSRQQEVDQEWKQFNNLLKPFYTD
jgi:midasin (ATPase involved in ribosome maturation)